jgi:hypothetical protein
VDQESRQLRLRVGLQSFPFSKSRMREGEHDELEREIHPGSTHCLCHVAADVPAAKGWRVAGHFFSSVSLDRWSVGDLCIALRETEIVRGQARSYPSAKTRPHNIRRKRKGLIFGIGLSSSLPQGRASELADELAAWAPHVIFECDPRKRRGTNSVHL